MILRKNAQFTELLEIKSIIVASKFVVLEGAFKVLKERGA